MKTGVTVIPVRQRLLEAYRLLRKFSEQQFRPSRSNQIHMRKGFGIETPLDCLVSSAAHWAAYVIPVDLLHLTIESDDCGRNESWDAERSPGESLVPLLCETYLD